MDTQRMEAAARMEADDGQGLVELKLELNNNLEQDALNGLAQGCWWSFCQ